MTLFFILYALAGFGTIILTVKIAQCGEDEAIWLLPVFLFWPVFLLIYGLHWSCKMIFRIINGWFD
jgi:hypothetical protein